MQIESGNNIFEQIVENYTKYIELGILKPNEKLPSCRELAIRLGINHKTVERAYNELIRKELVVSIPKKGYFVKSVSRSHNHIALESIKKLYEYGVSKNELLEVIKEVYGEDLND